MGRMSQYPEKKVYLSISVSVYQFLCSREKQAGWLRKYLCKNVTEVSRFVLEILGKSKFIASVQHPLKIPRPKNGTLSYVAFLLITHALSNSLQEIPYAITSNRSYFHVLKPMYWGLFTGVV